jgi:hypothetical protein
MKPSDLDSSMKLTIDHSKYQQMFKEKNNDIEKLRQF